MEILLIIAVIVATFMILSHWARRSGVARAHLLEAMPGDEVIGETGFITDRSTVIRAPAEAVWPWLVQLGNRRAGWYAPAWLERLLIYNQYKRGAHQIEPKYQDLHRDDVIDNVGKGSLKVIQIDAPHSLVYAGIKDDKHPERYLFSWSHLIEPIDDQSCRFYTRLRVRRPRRKFLYMLSYFLPLGGFYDYLITTAMFAGLKERLEK